MSNCLRRSDDCCSFSARGEHPARRVGKHSGALISAASEHAAVLGTIALKLDVLRIGLQAK